MFNKGLVTQEMSYGTCESAGEKAIGLDKDKRKNRGGGREGQTNELQSKTRQRFSTAHESNPPALAAKLDKFAYTRVYLYTESHSRGKYAHTCLK